jgi:Flp pilus assembly protein TadB
MKIEGKNVYEKICTLSYSLLRFKFSDEYIEKERRVLEFCNLNIPPTSNISAAFMFFTFSLVFLIFISFFFGFSLFPYLLAIISFLSFLIYYFPYLLTRYIRIVSSSEMTLCITYMVISLSRVPNLENAIFFAYKNLRGPLKKDFERIVADFNLRKIYSMEEGLKRIIDKWSAEAKEFSDALKLLVEYAKYPYRGEKILEEAVRLTVDGSFSKMTKYARDLKLPTTAILVLGIILPVIGLTLIPLLTIFLQGILDMPMVFFVYDFFLPLVLFSLVLMLVEGRPMTVSTVAGMSNPLVVNLGKGKLNLLLISFLFLLPALLHLLFGIASDAKNYLLCSQWAKAGFDSSKKPVGIDTEECKFYLTDLVYQSIKPSLLLSMLVLVVFLPLYVRNKKNIKEAERIRRVEASFGVLLFQLAHKTSSGIPLEEAVFSLEEKSQTPEVEAMIKELKKNLSIFGNIREALLGEQGIIKKYNSTIISSVFEIIVEVSSKGSLYLSRALSTFSKYLQNLSNLQEKIEDLISDNISTLKFMSYFLTPIVGGVSVSLGLIILAILGNLSVSLQRLLPKEAGLPSISLPIINLWGASDVPPSLFHLAIGIYVLELCILSSFFIVGLESGFDATYFIESLGKISLFSFLLFIVVSFVTYVFLSGLAISLFVGGE